MPVEYPQELLELCRSVRAKRPKTVINHILEHGFITSEELKDIYGYNHPPRAARDVRECGIPLETFRVEDKDGRKIAAYRFGELNKSDIQKKHGRTVLSKQIKDYLVSKHGARCSIYLEKMDESELQIDHRIPYEITGDVDTPKESPDEFMLLCNSANRAKSWSCEHCHNWKNKKQKEICSGCYWAFPENYTHVAMQQVRRTDILWQDDEVSQYECLKNEAIQSGQTIPEYIKQIIQKALK